MADETIGERLRVCRRYRGMSLQVLADRTGLSKSFLSMAENGKRQLERRSDIAVIADVLELSPSELTGQPYALPRSRRSSGHAVVPGVRQALLASSIDAPLDIPSRGLTELTRATARVERLCEESDYPAFGGLLPDLLSELHVAAVSKEERARREALRLLVRACHAAFYLVKDLGYLDLANIAAWQASDAANRLGDPALSGLAAFLRAHALMPAGYRCQAPALATARDAVGRVQSVPDVATRDVCGMLHLTAALISVNMRRVDEAREHLAEAVSLATSAGESNAFGLRFGSTNVGFWRVNLTVEMGDGGRAVEIARRLSPGRLESKGRQAAFHADVGRGLARMSGHDREAIEEFRRAESLAGEQVRNNPFVRDTVAHLLHCARREAGGRDLRGLAYRMGLG
ncbi:MAG: helix-turn-helix domain-containing protein [Streptosporangiaceae bacterium]